MPPRASHFRHLSPSSPHNKVRARRKDRAHRSWETGPLLEMAQHLQAMAEMGRPWNRKDSLRPCPRRLPNKYSCQPRIAGVYSVYLR